jgi:hypothetical protein
MNLRLNRYFLLGGCLLTVVVYAILFQVMVHTRLIEKVMTLTCSGGEFLLIVGFLVSRIVSYLVVPPLLLALVGYALLSWKRSASEDWSEEYGEGGPGKVGTSR